MYLWHILHMDENELISNVYFAQKCKMTKGDWCQIIDQIKEQLSIEKTDNEIKTMTKDSFKSYLVKKVENSAFEYLQELASKHSKSKYTFTQCDQLREEPYLRDQRFCKQDIQLIFALKTRMLDLKYNFKTMYNNNMECQTCDDKLSIENENHLLNCDNLKTDESSTVKFEDVYGNTDTQLKAVKIFRKIISKRNTIIELETKQ